MGNLKYDIYYLKKELRQEEIRLDELKAKVDTNSSIREIEEKAKEELNMDYLKKNQIRYAQGKMKRPFKRIPILAQFFQKEKAKINFVTRVLLIGHNIHHITGHFHR